MIVDFKGVVVIYFNVMYNLEVIEVGFYLLGFEEGEGEKVGVFWLFVYYDMGLIGIILILFFVGW